MDVRAIEKMNADDIGSEVDNWEDNRWRRDREQNNVCAV